MLALGCAGSGESLLVVVAFVVFFCEGVVSGRGLLQSLKIFLDLVE